MSADCGLSANATARIKKVGGGKPRAKRRITLGTLNATVPSGVSTPVEIKLTRKGSRKFAAAGRLQVKLAIDVTVPAGQTTAAKHSQRLRAPKRRR